VPTRSSVDVSQFHRKMVTGGGDHLSEETAKQAMAECSSDIPTIMVTEAP